MTVSHTNLPSTAIASTLNETESEQVLRGKGKRMIKTRKRDQRSKLKCSTKTQNRLESVEPWCSCCKNRARSKSLVASDEGTCKEALMLLSRLSQARSTLLYPLAWSYQTSFIRSQSVIQVLHFYNAMCFVRQTMFQTSSAALQNLPHATLALRL